jgi:general secretion pathway protein H
MSRSENKLFSLRSEGELRGRRHPAQDGFTLLELTVVLALMALLMGLVMPSLLRIWHRENQRAAIRALTVTLRVARSEAATTGRRVRLFLDIRSGHYRLEGSSRQGDLTGLGLTGARLVWQNPERTEGYIAFYGDGSSSGGRLVLTEPTGRRNLLEVKPITGKVSLGVEGI